jgi:hypothetical protein
MFLLAFFLEGTVQVVGDADGSQLDLARCPLGGAVRRQRVKVEGSGRDPSRWVTADGFIPSSTTGVFFDSYESQWAMGSLQLKVVLILFFGAGGQ